MNQVGKIPEKFRDRIVEVVGDDAGGYPTLVVVNAMHGNEVAGVRASRRAYLSLAAIDGAFHGRVVFVLGNLRAFGEVKRFIDVDFNRIWDEASLRNAPRDREHESSEETERRELLECLNWIEETAEGEICVLDLHSTSSDSSPFGIAYPSERTARLMEALPLPFVVGLAGKVDGTLLHYCSEQKGYSSIIVEGGQHEATETAERLLSTIVLIASALGMISQETFPELAEHRARLEKLSNGIPPRLEVVYRHAVEPSDDFQMAPGYLNFQSIAKGEVLARDGRGEIISPVDGHIFLPLYQAQGSDGFFIVSPLSV